MKNDVEFSIDILDLDYNKIYIYSDTISHVLKTFVLSKGITGKYIFFVTPRTKPWTVTIRFEEIEDAVLFRLII
jgi:hypothetical protein